MPPRNAIRERELSRILTTYYDAMRRAAKKERNTEKRIPLLMQAERDAITSIFAATRPTRKEGAS